MITKPTRPRGQEVTGTVCKRETPRQSLSSVTQYEPITLLHQFVPCLTQLIMLLLCKDSSYVSSQVRGKGNMNSIPYKRYSVACYRCFMLNVH